MKKKQSPAQKRAIKASINTRLAAQRGSRTCPYCKDEKPRGWPVCNACREILPQRIRTGLTGLIGFGYNAAFTMAMTYLERFARSSIPEPETAPQPEPQPRLGESADNFDPPY